MPPNSGVLAPAASANSTNLHKCGAARHGAAYLAPCLPAAVNLAVNPTTSHNPAMKQSLLNFMFISRDAARLQSERGAKRMKLDAEIRAEDRAGGAYEMGEVYDRGRLMNFVQTAPFWAPFAVWASKSFPGIIF